MDQTMHPDASTKELKQRAWRVLKPHLRGYLMLAGLLSMAWAAIVTPKTQPTPVWEEAAAPWAFAAATLLMLFVMVEGWLEERQQRRRLSGAARPAGIPHDEWQCMSQKGRQEAAAAEEEYGDELARIQVDDARRERRKAQRRAKSQHAKPEA